jgi:hypothetical protein
VLTRGSRLVALGVFVAAFAAVLRAHDEQPKPVAGLVVEASGERLTVRAHLPVAALADVNLPREPGGRLARNDLGPSLAIVARELASSLELAQDGAPLPMPTRQAAVTAEEGFIDVELGYVIRAGGGNLSARLRPFRAGASTVAIVARVVVSPGMMRTFEVSEGSERVTFDPDRVTAVTAFVGRGARALIANWDVLLFAICLVVPQHVRRGARSGVPVMLAGETVAATVAAWWSPFEAAVLPAVAAIGASAIVIAALQAIISPASRWRAPLALLFGTASGLALGDTFRGSIALAGGHPVASFAALVVVVLLGQLWMVALIASATGLLYRWGLAERAAIIAASVGVCHEALGRVVDRATAFAQTTTIGLDRFLTGLTLAWALAVILAGVLSAIRAGGGAVSRLAGGAGARP